MVLKFDYLVLESVYNQIKEESIKQLAINCKISEEEVAKKIKVKWVKAFELPFFYL